MLLIPYKDEFAPFEADERLGSYLLSYAAEHGRVEVHLFRSPANQLAVYVTKSPRVPVAEAHAAVREALRFFAESHAAPRPAQPLEVVYDSSSIGHSGSI